MHRTGHEVGGSLIAVEGVPKLRLDLLRVLRVVPALLEELVNRDGGILKELVRLLGGGALLGESPRSALTLGEHVVGFV